MVSNGGNRPFRDFYKIALTGGAEVLTELRAKTGHT
jgi:hypothetical protein